MDGDEAANGRGNGPSDLIELGKGLRHPVSLEEALRHGRDVAQLALPHTVCDADREDGGSGCARSDGISDGALGVNGAHAVGQNDGVVGRVGAVSPEGLELLTLHDPQASRGVGATPEVRHRVHRVLDVSGVAEGVQEENTGGVIRVIDEADLHLEVADGDEVDDVVDEGLHQVKVVRLAAGWVLVAD